MSYTYNSDIFNKDQKIFIELALLHNVGTQSDIFKLMTSLDKNGKPIFDSQRMNEIVLGFEYCLSYEEIFIYCKIRNDKPFFKPDEMRNIRRFIETADEKQIQQIKECVDGNFTYSQLSPLLNKELSAEKIRILKSLIAIGVNCDRIQALISENHPYEELKDIKYREQCINELILNQYKDSYVSYVTTIDMRKIFDKTVFLEKTPYYSNKRDRVLGKAFKSKLPPEQIFLLCDAILSADNMQSMYDGFLKGISAKEMKNIINQYKKEEFLIPLNVLIKDELEARRTMKELNEKDNYKNSER